MAGRHRRKISNSTVATIDTSQTRWLKESDIVKPMPEDIRGVANSNKWPCYVLTDATVYLKDGKRLANPLLPNQPWVVRGKLEVDPKEQRHLRITSLVLCAKRQWLTVAKCWIPRSPLDTLRLRIQRCIPSAMGPWPSGSAANAAGSNSSLLRLSLPRYTCRYVRRLLSTTRSWKCLRTSKTIWKITMLRQNKRGRECKSLPFLWTKCS